MNLCICPAGVSWREGPCSSLFRYICTYHWNYPTINQQSYYLPPQDHASVHSWSCSDSLQLFVLWIMLSSRELLDWMQCRHDFSRNESRLLTTLGLALSTGRAARFHPTNLLRARNSYTVTRSDLRNKQCLYNLYFSSCWNLPHVQSYSFLHVYDVDICKSTSRINTDHICSAYPTPAHSYSTFPSITFTELPLISSVSTPSRASFSVTEMPISLCLPISTP